jgi:hypothetical protein
VTRVLATTFLFIIVGAAAGVVVAFASLAPLWLGTSPLRGTLTDPWIAGIVSAMGAICGAIVTPVLGWIVIDRVGFWRAVLEPMAGAIVCTIVAGFALRSLQTDVLIYAAFIGALLATARIRFTKQTV